MKCYRCKNESQIKLVEKYLYKEAGLQNVYLKNIEVRVCEICNLSSPLIPKIIHLHNTIARAIICKKSLLLGEEVRFLRKNLRLKSQDWANYLRKDVATISRAEKEGNILNKDLDLLIRLLYVRIWEENKEKLFAEEIFVNFKNINLGILIDVENIENYSYVDLQPNLNLVSNEKVQPGILQIA